MGWGLFNPLLLLGLSALAVPVMVHLAQRQERDGRRFPSLMFLRQIPFQARRHRTLRDPWLLLLRCLALALLVLGFAAPYLERAAAPAASSESDLVLVLDRSYSMSADGHWNAARQAVLDRVDSLEPGQRAALVAFDDRAEVVQALTGDAVALRSALDTVQPGSNGTRFGAGLAEAGRALNEGSARTGTLVLISDLQTSGASDLGALSLDPEVTLEVVPVTGPVGANAAIMSARLVNSASLPSDLGTDLEVVVRNTGDAALQAGELSLELDGRRVESRTLELAVGGSQTVVLPLSVARDQPLDVRLRLGADAVAADNTHNLILPPRGALRVALIEAAEPVTAGGLFISEALRLARSPEVSLRRLSPGALNPAALSDTQVIIWNAVSLPTGPAAEALSAFVTGGGGLLVVAARDAGSAWPDYLPGQLGPRRSADAEGLGVLADEAGGAIASAFAGDMGAALDGVRVWAYRSLQATTPDQVPLRLEDGAPLLAGREHGAGRAMVLTSALDTGWNSLPLEPGFPPLLQAAVRWLANWTQVPGAYRSGSVADLRAHAVITPGAADWLSYLAEQGQVVVEMPEGGARRLRAGQALLPIAEAGIYEAHRADGVAPALRIAVNADRSESMFEPLDAADLVRRVARRSITASAQATGPEPDAESPVGLYLLAVALALLLLESGISNRLSVGRGRLPEPASAANRTGAAP